MKYCLTCDKFDYFDNALGKFFHGCLIRLCDWCDRPAIAKQTIHGWEDRACADHTYWFDMIAA